jgi:NAD(P)-dependent dehydrogenase (short-subunit alcohol dehydrogenase family)
MKGKVMAITGAFGSLGRVVAKRAAECCFQLALIDNAASPADVGSFGQDSLLLPMVDLSDAAAAGKAVDVIIAKLAPWTCSSIWQGLSAGKRLWTAATRLGNF